MKQSLLKSLFQMVGFAIVGLIFFVWFIGNRKNSTNAVSQHHDSPKMSANLQEEQTQEVSEDEITFSSSDFTGPKYKKPPLLRTKNPHDASPNTAGEPSSFRKEVAVAKKEAKIYRSWKGAHRDKAFARRIHDRFYDEIMELSEEYGLYPEVFLARVIAYSYEFVEHAKADPYDRNFTAMERPGGEGRARFAKSHESLKAYAIVNAGEVNRLSSEAALAKHDRSWTMRKIVDRYGFINEMGVAAAQTVAYDGAMGVANRLSIEEAYAKEYAGEAIKMASTVDDKVKEEKAKKAGYDKWEDYLESLDQEEKATVQNEADEKVTAIQKKKAFNLSRRVAAKEQKRRN